MQPYHIPATLLFLVTLACGAPATPAVSENVIQTQVAGTLAAMAATDTSQQATAYVETQAAPAETQPPTELPPSATPTGVEPTEVIIPTAAPPIPPEGYAPVYEFDYQIQEEHRFGSYIVRRWQNMFANAMMNDGIVTIAAHNQLVYQINNAIRLGDMSGSDLNGNGTPDLVVETYSGGAHCCSGTQAFDFSGDTYTQILDKQPNNCGGRFEDLDGDGVYEFTTCDDIFAYAYCSFAASIPVAAVLRYDPTRQFYVAAGADFPDFFAPLIPQHQERAENGTPGELGEWDNTTKCSVLPLILTYLYSGQTETAWREFERLYTFDDATAWRAEIEQTIAGSYLYTTP